MPSVRIAAKQAIRKLGYNVTSVPDLYEDLAAHLDRLFRLYRIDTVLDVGANQGQHAAFLRNLGFKGRIVSFEPVPDNYAVLESRARQDPAWDAYQIALGQRDAQSLMNVTRSTLFSSFLTPNEYSHAEFGRQSEVVRVEEVEIRRLDGFLTEHPDIVGDRLFLKLDTQGYDLPILQGAGSELHRVRALQSEISVRPIYDGMTGYLEAIDEMTRMGFGLTGLFPVNRDASLRVIELDCVMVNQENDRA